MLSKKIVIFITVFSFFFSACKTQGIWLTNNDKYPQVRNVQFTQENHTVNIYYDLLAESSDTKFDIELMLSLGNQRTYTIDSTSTNGAIGKGVLAGKKKKITWNALEDFPQGIQGKEIQFIINANKVDSNGTKKWVYYTGGALLVGAAAVLGYLYLLPGDHKLPAPPSRPSAN